MKYLAACCTAKNEAPHILEWMAFHRAVGFEHLIIIDHSSSDSTAQVVAQFADQASVTLIRWGGPGTQMDMYNSVTARHKADFHWCAFIDVDEFLYTADHSDIRNLMTEYESCDAVGVHWLVYGSAGHIAKQNGLTIENYTHRAENGFTANHHIKSIVKLGSAGPAETSHLFWTPSGTVNENFQLLPFRAPHGYYPDEYVSHHRLRINHYHTRSREDYEQKSRRGFFGDDKLGTAEKMNAMFSLHDRNEISDNSALRYRDLMNFYLKDCRHVTVGSFHMSR